MPIMSACAWSCQRPPRSRARSSRISSHNCSESTSTPSMSKTTAAISDGVVATLPIDEAGAWLSLVDGDDLADEDRVVARVVALPEAALEPCQRVLEQRSARVAVPDGDVVPQHERRRAAREVRGDVGLVAAEDRDAERAREAQKLVERELAPDRDADERRIERQRDQRSHRRRHALSFDVRA